MENTRVEQTDTDQEQIVHTLLYKSTVIGLTEPPSKLIRFQLFPVKYVSWYDSPVFCLHYPVKQEFGSLPLSAVPIPSLSC